VTPPPATYDTGRTRYPTMPPVVVVGPTVFDPTYYHDYYYGRPWYWRIWHRPYYTASGGWGVSWTAVIVGLVVLWILLGLLSSILAKRRRNR
jgi:uncharacterized membrane protein